MNNPLVSIITCTYNRAGMLAEAVSSILAQKYDPVERIVVDDGSTDDTGDVMAAYGDDIRYYHQEHKGMEAALNVACRRLARGEYIAINDDDDLMLPDRIPRLYEALRRFPRAVLAVGDAELIDAWGNRTGERISFAIKVKREQPVLIENGYEAILWPLISPATCATLFRRADGERVGWFDEDFRRGSDTDFFGRLARLGPIVYVPGVVAYCRRGHPSKWDGHTANSLLCEISNLMLFEKHL
ncbi:MAG: glycosyltransferase, partial [Nitrospiraceae bacterium]|nr:glycosyltransferase [Nitrospiraceae bacterium]